jgi:hypothetical protein
LLLDRAARRETPVDVHVENPSRDERLRAFIRNALEEAFAVSSKDIVRHLEALIAAQGAVNLLDLPVGDARSLLLALCAVESVRGESDFAKLDVTRRDARRENGVFEANDYRFTQRA